ncbi:hypothetical protein IP86_03065 [Rhodopseudomonas sp. AAP120]|uniref:DUF7146 domain-containing protein n=1 Tax=Rhodopseudomonas sp. AAP120 TaxID=1523430 RepID=UPI0006B8B72D|nr:hypothetical protein [Rhodopseudomonas sp. AAP120]KPG01803.1 hypothetical protein IP86_03065 [Rhodopseudomonas sp. AAP120]
MTINLRTRQGWEDLKRILDDRIGEVLNLCGLDLPRRGGWTVLDDPLGQGHDSFGLCLRADGLSWKRFNGTEKGRALELIAYCNGWYDLANRGAEPAARLAMQRLGLGRIDEAQLARDRAAAAERRAQAEKDGRDQAERRAAAAFAIFVNAQPVLGTVADYYLRERRGIDLSAPPFIGPRGGCLAPGSLRFAPQHRYVIRDRRNLRVGEYFGPALIACCTDAEGRVRAVHQTWLRPDGSDKADIPPAPDGKAQKARRVLGDFKGLVIPLWRGDGHLSVREACEHGVLQTLGLSEGVEDGLTGVLAKPDWRWWAAISLSNIANVASRLPDCIDAVMVHRQNDWDKPEAVAAFDAGMAALRASGRAVADFAAFGGKDINDTLRGEG